MRVQVAACPCVCPSACDASASARFRYLEDGFHAVKGFNLYASWVPFFLFAFGGIRSNPAFIVLNNFMGIWPVWITLLRFVVNLGQYTNKYRSMRGCICGVLISLSFKPSIHLIMLLRLKHPILIIFYNSVQSISLHSENPSKHDRGFCERLSCNGHLFSQKVNREILHHTIRRWVTPIGMTQSIFKVKIPAEDAHKELLSWVCWWLSIFTWSCGHITPIRINQPTDRDLWPLLDRTDTDLQYWWSPSSCPSVVWKQTVDGTCVLLPAITASWLMSYIWTIRRRSLQRCSRVRILVFIMVREGKSVSDFWVSKLSHSDRVVNGRGDEKLLNGTLWTICEAIAKGRTLRPLFANWHMAHIDKLWCHDEVLRWLADINRDEIIWGTHVSFSEMINEKSPFGSSALHSNNRWSPRCFTHPNQTIFSAWTNLPPRVQQFPIVFSRTTKEVNDMIIACELLDGFRPRLGVEREKNRSQSFQPWRSSRCNRENGYFPPQSWFWENKHRGVQRSPECWAVALQVSFVGAGRKWVHL